ncbi:MAG TPA: SDR family NAD(P)-dependent oxidoreductase [Candidatus Limiplasma sp.]|nr:SDR family NAD(P)-dependent oxidoreductase [Candidatus Limiplasma sp.]HRX07878.1 SDR family NAD(P)-dependent oxidoreductase [Candidatus Limiplasma sp.]
MKYTKNDLVSLRQRGAKQHTTDARLHGKLCVITGATSGVGLAAARRLAQGGAKLVLVARNRDKAETVQQELVSAYGAEVHIVIADFMRLDEVRRAGEEIRAAYPVIDILINSAGLYSMRRKMTPDGNEMTFQVNHLASFMLTMLLINNISKSPQGRIIQVNSEGHRFGGLHVRDLDWSIRFYIGLRAYGASKLAQLLTMRTIAELLEGTGATINCMHPGTVGSNIGNNNGPIYRGMMAIAKRLFMKSPVISGDALYYLAAAPELSKTTGRYFFLTVDVPPMATALDDALRGEIWQKSLELTGLTQAL